VPGPAVAGLPPPRRHGHARLLLPGLAGVPAAPAGAPTGQAPPAFFPLGPTAGVCPCRRSTDASSIGCGVRPCASKSADSAPIRISWIGSSLLPSVHYSTDKAVLASKTAHSR